MLCLSCSYCVENKNKRKEAVPSECFKKNIFLKPTANKFFRSELSKMLHLQAEFSHIEHRHRHFKDFNTISNST